MVMAGAERGAGRPLQARRPNRRDHTASQGPRRVRRHPAAQQARCGALPPLSMLCYSPLACRSSTSEQWWRLLQNYRPLACCAPSPRHTPSPGGVHRQEGPQRRVVDLQHRWQPLQDRHPAHGGTPTPRPLPLDCHPAHGGTPSRHNHTHLTNWPTRPPRDHLLPRTALLRHLLPPTPLRPMLLLTPLPTPPLSSPIDRRLHLSGDGG